MEDTLSLPQVLDAVYLYSKKQKFLGHNKHDGLNSPLLRLACGWAKWPRICAIQLVMRMPVNIRSLVLIPRTLNPKGLALFIQGLLCRYKVEQDNGYLAEAETLLEKLLEVRSTGDWSGSCWGYPYPWQDLGFFSPPHTPNAVVTSFVCEAFLEAYRLTGKQRYIDVVGEAVEFFLNDLEVLEDVESTLCLGYMPLPMSMKVMDVSILIGAVIAQYTRLSEEQGDYNTVAERLVRFVVEKQTEYGAWYYTDPPGDSLIRHDNYHTGFILDALWRYMVATDDWQWKNVYEKGLKFYAEELFNADGSPRWMSDKDFPHDVHGSAQGLVTFSLAVENKYPYGALLDKIGQWALTNLYHPSGRFYYRQNRLYTSRFTLLRWCNAWMFRGLALWNNHREQ